MRTRKFAFLFTFMLLCFSFCGVMFNNTPVFASESTATNVSDVSDVNALASAIENNKNIVLGSDIELSLEWQLSDFSGTLDGNNKTITVNGFGIFNSIENATIKNLHIVWNVQSVEDSFAYLGAVAGKAVNSTLSQIKLKIDAEKPVTITTDNSFNIGGLVGALTSGSKIIDCEVRANNELKIVQTNSEAFSSYVGAVAGFVQDSTIANVISAVDMSINYDGEYVVPNMSLGGLAGYVEGKKSKVASSLVASNLSTEEVSNVNIGMFIGEISDASNKVPTLSENGFISKLVSCVNESIVPAKYDHNAVGDLGAYTLSESEYLLKQQKNKYTQKNTYFNFYNDIFAWDFDETWYESDNLITLQKFVTFTITVDDSIESYGLVSTVKPKEVLSFDTLTAECEYGETHTITAKFNNIEGETVSYEYFFKIGRLMVDGQPTEIEEQYNEVDNTYSWDIKNVNASKIGEYSVELVPKVYSIKVKPSDLSQGKVKNYLVEKDEIILSNISYGGTYSVYSTPEKYFISDGWQVGGINVTDIATSTNSSLTFTFSEGDNFTKTYLLDKEPENDILATIDAQFSASFCTIIFNVVLDGSDYNADTNIAIDVNGERLVLNKDNRFEIKVPLNNVNIEISNLPNSERFTYKLEGWTNDADTRFNFAPDTTESTPTKEFTIQLTTIEVEKSLTWLWILLGGIGGCLLIAGIVVLIIYKRKQDGSYKKYYF